MVSFTSNGCFLHQPRIDLATNLFLIEWRRYAKEVAVNKSPIPIATTQYINSIHSNQ